MRFTIDTELERIIVPATVSKYVREYEASVRTASVLLHAKEKEIAR